MADEFPDPDEEFELMHAEEIEAMNEMEAFDLDEIGHNCGPKAKRSLEFNSPKSCSKQSKSIFDSQPLLQHNLSQNGIGKPLSSQQTATAEVNTEEINSEEPVNTEILINALDDVQTNHNKRSVDDLFGDIADIDFEDEHLSKKSKNDELTEEERQLLTIETIVQERKRLQESKILPRLSTTGSKSGKCNSADLSRSVPRWNFMPLTDKKGERIYARLRSEESYGNEISEVSNHKHTGGLLSIPFEQLEKLAHEQLQRKWEKIDKLKLLDQDIQVVERPEEQLWVEKYKPKSYVELLSDEGTNRAILQWLKLWDKVVFNREPKFKIKPKEEFKGKGFKFQKKTGPMVNEELDEFGRPHHKVALLCGPPGLGKTTLAHMLAQQAGYNVVEVNASDDRNPEVFRNQLVAATQMKAVMGAERRPNCLVLDEIDGAPAASIDVVLKFVQGKMTSKKKSKKDDTGGHGILKRPIICICNDVYISSLRPLRQMAFVVHFPPTTSARLATRLCEVARLQSLKTDLGVMMALSEKTNNDIRSCLSLLQGLTLGKGGSVRLGHVHSASLGLKDMQKGLFAVWQEIFQIQLPKRKAFVDTISRDTVQQPSSSERKASTSSLSGRVSSILKTVQGCGDYERLALGVFENYLNMKIKDSSMVSVAQGLSWFCNYDLLSTKINTTQNYILYPYLAYPFAIWHLLFANLAWPKLTYPSTGYEVRTKSEKNRQLVDEMLKCMQPGVRIYTYKEPLLLDTIPLLLRIIAPNLRPVSLALYSSKEKEGLRHVIGVMIDYSLTYTQERSPDGNFVFNLDPNVEEVGRFEEAKGRSLSYSCRQLMAREIELERLRRAEASLYRNADPESLANNGQTNGNQPTAEKGTAATTTPKGLKKKPLPNHLQKLTPKVTKKIENLPIKDFFGRIVETPLEPNQQKFRTDEIVKSDIWYHFKEGYNNAVRKNITMADLCRNRTSY